MFLHQNYIKKAYFFIELDVRKDGVDPPRLGEHRAEGERESGHQKPSPGRAYVRKGRDARQLRVQTQENYAAVRQHAPDYYEIVQMGRRHFDVPEMSDYCHFNHN